MGSLLLIYCWSRNVYRHTYTLTSNSRIRDRISDRSIHVAPPPPATNKRRDPHVDFIIHLEECSLLAVRRVWIAEFKTLARARLAIALLRVPVNRPIHVRVLVCRVLIEVESQRYRPASDVLA